MKLVKMSPYEIHRELFELMRDIKRICDDNQIRFFLGFGTMLGSIRDGGFIPWDDDLDILVLREDWNRFNKCILEQLDKEKYFVINAYTRKEYPYWAFITRLGINGTYRKMDYFKENKAFRSGIFIDAFVIEDVIDSPSLLKMQQFGLKIIDEQIDRKSKKKEYQSKMSISGRILGIMAGSKWSLETCNMIRNTVQTCLATYNATKLLVPMGPLGKYPLEKTLYDKKWFREEVEVPFNLIKDSEVLDTLYLPIPIEYEKILEKTYGKWKRRPRGKRPKGVSYWIKK